MKKYYKINKQHPAYNEYFEYNENSKKIQKIAKDFFKKWEIDANKYCVTNKTIFIVPQGTDAKRFGSSFHLAYRKNGIRKFKLCSEVGKDWRQTLSDANIEKAECPSLPFTPCEHGKTSCDAFFYNEALYLVAECECKIGDTAQSLPDGIEEIKISEYFAILSKAYEKLEKYNKWRLSDEYNKVRSSNKQG